LRSQLARVRSSLNASESAAVVPARARSGRAWLALGALGAAAILVAVISVALRARTGVAAVATALLQKPWIHTRTTGEGEGVTEQWYSPAKQIMASRRSGVLDYRDFRLEVYHSYNPKEGTVFRGPITWSAPNGPEAMFAGLKVLLQAERLPDHPLEQLKLSSKRERATVINQRVQKLTDQGQDLLDYQLTVKLSNVPEPMQLLFRVDAATMLPRLSRFDVLAGDGKRATVEIQYDYPNKGPTDIYDLGAPKGAKFVDRMPSDDLKRILESLRADRARMDNYRAVAFSQWDEPRDRGWVGDPVMLFWHDGKFRFDNISGGLTPLAKGEDLKTWWSKQGNRLQHIPWLVRRDSTRFFLQCRTETDADGSLHVHVGSVDKRPDPAKPGEDFVYFQQRPELVCRPLMGIGNPDTETLVEPHPADGPPGCILVTVRGTDTGGRPNNNNRVIPPDIWRYWLDTQRDYIAMRWERVKRDPAGKEVSQVRWTMEEVARSPKGVWYATKVRQYAAPLNPEQKRSDPIYTFYLDFDAELPDSLFDSWAPGRVPGAL
jgi:hypothetical protein